jgi:hypothetical protein
MTKSVLQSARIANQLGLEDPNAPIDMNDPKVRNVVVPAVQQFKRMGVGQVVQNGNMPPQPVQTAQAIPQQPQPPQQAQAVPPQPAHAAGGTAFSGSDSLRMSAILTRLTFLAASPDVQVHFCSGQKLPPGWKSYLKLMQGSVSHD